VNSRGVVGISGDSVDEIDIDRAVDAARVVAIPHDREIIHIIQRGFTVDGQDGIKQPIGMHGYRLEVEAHIITASATTVENLRQAVAASGVEVLCAEPLASAEVVLNRRKIDGSIVCDMGGGTTDLAIYVDGDVWHTMVLPVGGNHITQDIAQGMRLPITQAEEVKKQHGHSVKSEVGLDETISVRPFGEDQPILISRHDLAHIIEARVDEIFTLALQEIKRSGYDGLLPAGMVLTGGSSLLPGMRSQASRVLGMPVRTAQPENLVGLADKLNSPAYSTSVGLLYWATAMHEMLNPAEGSRRRRKGGRDWSTVRTFFKRLLP
jgi:cell division protein FtsA